MNDFSQFAEHSVKKECGENYSTKRTVYLILVIILVVGVNVFLSLLILGFYAFITLTISLPIAIMYARRIFADISYDYRITEGEIYFSAVYNNTKRKELGNVEISKFEAIAPYKDSYKDSADRITYVKTIDMTSSPDSDNIYYAVLTDPEDHSSKSIYFFELNEKMLKLLKFYNRSTVILRSKAE